MGISTEFQQHLAGGLTTLARCWRVERKDGRVFGFNDHDGDLAFEDTEFLADSGLTAFALEQGTGLGVDNTETLGALSAEAISEADISAGFFDGAEVKCWLVNWAEPSQRMVLFAGHIGEITRIGGRFQAEVRGLSEPLNQPKGRAYQKACSSILGDGRCQVDLERPEFTAVFSVQARIENSAFQLAGADGFENGWFTHGLLLHEVSGVRGVIKEDRKTDAGRDVTLWTPFLGQVENGDEIRLIAGCDGQFATCRFKFSNYLNFRGFPDIPGDGWITRVPRGDGVNDGGSLR